MIPSLLLAILTCGIPLLTVAAQPLGLARPSQTTMTPARIDAAVTKFMAAAHVTGAEIVIFHNGTVAYLKAYGHRDMEAGLPLTPDTVMTAASLSKAAFATMVRRLVQKGLLDLDKPIYQYLPRPLPEYPRYADLQGDGDWETSYGPHERQFVSTPEHDPTAAWCGSRNSRVTLPTAMTSTGAHSGLRDAPARTRRGPCRLRCATMPRFSVC